MAEKVRVLNALHPPPVPADAPTVPETGRTLRLIRRLCGFYGACAAAIALPLLLLPNTQLVLEARTSGLAGVALGAVLLALAGVSATLPVVRARRLTPPPLTPRQSRLARSIQTHPIDPAQRLARTARRPQGIIVPLLSACAAAAAWGWHSGVPAHAPDAVLLGAAAIVLSFPLLVAERIIAGVPATRLPEAANLQALLFVPVIIIPLAGVSEAASSLGAAWTRPAMTALALYLCLVAAELALRALSNWFLPPPAPAAARAAVASMAALALQPGRVAPEGVAGSLRTHLGLDFSRSWALRYVRSAALPVGLLIALLGWGLSGVTLVNLDQRGIYERFGAPVAVWQPGAHLGLPWPLGRVRAVDLGVVHAVALGGEDAGAARTAAEAPAPATADRLWDRPHPAEVSYVIAGVDSAGAQSFQSVSVDLRVLYGVGLDDASALRAAYAVAAPADLVRVEAGRLLARFFAGQVLQAVLGKDREALADRLRAALQDELDRLGSGLAVAAVVIEAIHPPPAAAEAYHNVQASEIVANTAIATERGRAQASAAMARQVSTGLTNDASGAAAETVGRAAVLLRGFTADQAAASTGGQAFLLERYFANLSSALAKSPLVIVDHRLAGADAPVIDLRSFGAPSGGGVNDD